MNTLSFNQIIRSELQVPNQSEKEDKDKAAFSEICELFPIEVQLGSNKELQALFPNIGTFNITKVLQDLRQNNFHNSSLAVAKTISEDIATKGFHVIKNTFDRQLEKISTFFNNIERFPQLSFSERPYEKIESLNNERHFMCESLAFYFSLKNGTLSTNKLATKNFKSDRTYFYADVEGKVEDYLQNTELQAIKEILQSVGVSISEYKNTPVSLSGRVFLAKEPGKTYQGSGRLEKIKISWHQDRIENKNMPLDTSEFLLALITDSHRGTANGLTGGNLLIGSLNSGVGTVERRRTEYTLDFEHVSLNAVVPMEKGYGYLIEQNRETDSKSNPRVHSHTLGTFALTEDNQDCQRNVIICQINTDCL